jgi:hypothetical protein
MSSKPETQLVAIARADGGLTILQLVTKERRNGETVWEQEPTDEAIAAVIAKADLDCVSWRRITAADIPADRYFRNAWTDGGAAIAVDMPKARDIHRDRMRQARQPRLAALDIEYQRADERGDAAAKADIAARKQALRDVTADPAIEAAKTPEDLHAVWPAVLA